MAVYREYIVDIPKEHVTIEKQSGGKPSLIKYVLEAPYDREKGYAKPKRATIGHQCPNSTTTMHPTTQYEKIFPELWEAVSNKKTKPAVKRIGLFSACQAINAKTGIKGILDSVYGSDRSGAILDYALYSILYHTAETSLLASRMRNELMFTKEPYSDTWYSNLFETRMSDDQELLFKKKWALQCKKDGVETVWLCIDGSNDDCQSKGVEIAEKGHAKSKKNINIVSYTYAVTPEGKPVTFKAYRGGLVDAKALKQIIDFLNQCGIKVCGVILDRGYCDQNALKFLISKNLKYVIMIKGTPEGYDRIVGVYGSSIKMNAEYLVPHTFLFGVQEEVQLFKGFAHKDYITLFYDYQNGGERITALLRNIYREMDSAEAKLQKGEIPVFDGKYKDFLTLEKNPESTACMSVRIVSRKLQEAMDEKGLYGVLTSDRMEPEKVHLLYSSRGASETQYMLFKSQLGFDSLNVHFTAGVKAKFTAGFIAMVIRHELESAAKPLGRNVNQIVQELEKLEAQKINDTYTYTHVETDRQKAFFKNLGTEAEQLIDEAVRYENDRLAGRAPVPRRRKTGPKKGSHHKKYDEQGQVIPRKSGVKPGTKQGEINKDGTPRKKPGVKPGTIRGKYNKDGSIRKKPGPKTGSKTGHINQPTVQEQNN